MVDPGSHPLPSASAVTATFPSPAERPVLIPTDLQVLRAISRVGGVGGCVAVVCGSPDERKVFDISSLISLPSIQKVDPPAIQMNARLEMLYASIKEQDEDVRQETVEGKCLSLLGR